MSAANILADPTRTQLRLATLRLWVEAGMALLRRAAEDLGADLLGLGRIVLRLSRGIRLALALHARLSDPWDPLSCPAAARARPARTEESESEAEASARLRSARVSRPRPDADLTCDDAILRRPLAEIVRVICKALGVVPDWGLWSDDATPAGRPAPSVAPPPPDPDPDPARPRPRPALALAPPPVTPRLLTRLRSSCAAGALDPIAAPATGRSRSGAA